MSKQNIITIKKKLHWKDTLLALTPFTWSVFVWMFIFYTGFSLIKSSFEGTDWYPLTIIVWLISLMPLLTKMVSPPENTCEVEETLEGTLLKEEKEDG